MARIKFTQEDLSGFGARQQYYKPILIQESNPAAAINTIRAGVEGAVEVAGAAKDFADFLTKTGAIGKEKTKEQLLEEAAKKRSEEVMKARGAEREKLLQQQQAEIAATESLGKGPSVAPELAGVRPETEIANKRKEVANVISQFQSGQLDPDAFATQIDSAANAGVITQEEKNKYIDVATKMKVHLEGRAKELSYRPSADIKQGLSSIYANVQQDIDLSKQTIAELKSQLSKSTDPQQNVALQQKIDQEQFELDNKISDQNKLKEQIENKSVLENIAGTRPLAEQLKLEQRYGLMSQEGPNKPILREPPALGEIDKEKAFAAIPEAKVRDIANLILGKPELERTEQEVQFLKNASTKYPDIVSNIGGVGAAMRGGRTAGTALQITKGVIQPINDFVAGIEKRKAEIAQDVTKTREEKQKEFDKLTDALKVVTSEPPAGSDLNAQQRVVMNAINGIKDLWGKGKGPTSEADIRNKQMETAEFLAKISDPKTVQDLVTQEESRTDGLKLAAAGILDATAAIQGLNNKRATSGLTPDEATQLINLTKYLSDNMKLVNEVKNLKVEDPQFTDMVIKLHSAVNEGKAPEPETAQQRDARFANTLKMFDAATAAEIEKATNEAKKTASADIIDADQLRLLAAQAAINSDEKLAAQILEKMKSGKIVGIPPRQFTDIFTGDHKDAFQKEIIGMLFTRAKGKSDEELALMQRNLLLKAAANEARMEEQAKRTEKLTEEVDFLKGTKEDRTATEAAERRVKEADASKKEWENSAQVRQAELDRLMGAGKKAVIEGDMWEKVLTSKVRQANAMAGYFGNRLSVEIRKMDEQGNEKAKADILDVSDKFGTQIGNALENEKKEAQALGFYKKYVDDNGSINSTFNTEFPAPPSQGSSDTQRKAYNDAVRAAGGQEEYAKRRNAILDYQRKAQGGGETFNNKEEAKSALSYVNNAATKVRAKLASLDRSSRTFDADANALRDKLIKLTKTFQEIQTRTGVFQNKKSSDVKTDVDTITSGL